jgi:hypothetical protein
MIIIIGLGAAVVITVIVAVIIGVVNGTKK